MKTRSRACALPPPLALALFPVATLKLATPVPLSLALALKPLAMFTLELPLALARLIVSVVVLRSPSLSSIV